MRSTLVTLLVILVTPLSSIAQSAVGANATERGWSFEAGLGFTSGPDTFLMQLEAPYHFSSNVTIGPQLQIGVSDATTLVAMSANTRLSFDMTNVTNENLRKLEPFVNGGIGLAFVDRTVVDEVGFLMHFGFGVAYKFSTQVAAQSAMQFNIIPGGAAGEKFFYTWQIAGIRYRF